MTDASRSAHDAARALRDLALVLRPVLARPGRLVASVLGVAVGVAAVVSTLAGSGAAVSSLGEDVEMLAGPSVLEVRGPGGVPTAALEPLRPLCDEVLLVPVVEDTVLVAASDRRVRVLGLDLLADRRLVEAGVRTGAAIDDAAGARELLFGTGVLVPSGLAEELGAVKGGSLELTIHSRRSDVAVVDVFDPGRLASPWADTLVADVDTARELFDRGERFDRVEFVPREAATSGVEALRERARGLLAGTAFERLRVEPPSTRRAEGERMVSALRFNLAALSGVSMLVGVALVATTLATSVVQRRERLALMRSLGASRLQLGLGVLGEAATIGLVGGAVGVARGSIGADLAVAGVRGAAFSIAPRATGTEVRFESWWIGLGLALGLGSATLAALLPLREAASVPPIQGLRSERPRPLRARGHAIAWSAAFALLAIAAVLLQLPPIGRRPVYALTATVVVMGACVATTPSVLDAASRLRVGGAVVLRLAQAGLSSSLGRASWATGAVAIAVGLAIAMTTFVGSFRRTITEWTEDALSADVLVRSSSVDGMRPEAARAIAAAATAGDVAFYRESPAWFGDATIRLGGSDFGVMAAHSRTPMVAGGATRDVFARALREQGVIVNEPFARQFDRWVGDDVTIEAADGVLAARVVGVAREYAGQEGRVYVDAARYAELVPDPTVASIALFLPEGADAGEQRERMARAVPADSDAAVVLRRELITEVMSIFDRSFAVTVALQILASIAAALAVVTVLGALVRERRFDLAVVRVVGATRRQVTALVLGEAFVLGAVGAAIGATMGVAIGWILVAVVNVQSHGWSLSFVPPWVALCWTAAAVVPACLVAGLPPAYEATARVPREVLRENG
ncbi:MAG: ABC transporter permease [Planctomycetota bacterium]